MKGMRPELNFCTTEVWISTFIRLVRVFIKQKHFLSYYLQYKDSQNWLYFQTKIVFLKYYQSYNRFWMRTPLSVQV